jgi:histidinol-phosphate/aromatic aminotransferase/cobyric acid decarboxylase-like protein
VTEYKYNPNYQEISRINISHPKARWIRLDINEGMLSECAHRSIHEAILSVNPSRYPDSDILKNKIAQYAEIDSCKINITAGSDQAIFHTMLALKYIDRQLIIIEPTYGMVDIYANLIGYEIEKISYSNPSQFPLDKLLQTVRQHPNCIVYLANPNVLGYRHSKELISSVVKELEKSDSILVLDQAYEEFNPKITASFCDFSPNVVITRSLSKFFGLSGMRVGYTICNPILSEIIGRGIPPFSVSSYSIAATLAVLENITPSSIQKLNKEKINEIEHRLELLGWPYSNTDTNFLFFDPKEYRTKLLDELINEKIMIRESGLGLFHDWMRISISDLNGVDKFNAVLDNLIIEDKSQ